MLFPVQFNDKNYYKKDCDEMFLSLYYTREALNDLGGVYMAEDLWIYPDGSMDFY